MSIDEQGTILEWNPQAESVFGWSRKEAVGRKLKETIIPPSFRDLHEEGLRRFLTSGEGPYLNRRVELVAQHKNGHQLPVEISISPLRVGKRYEFNAFLHDIRARKASEAQIRFHAWLLAMVHDAVVSANDRFVVTFWNPAAERLYGWTEDEVLGRRLFDFLPTEVLGATPRSALRRLVKTGEFRGEFLQRRKDGRIVPVEVTAMVLRDARRHVTGYVCVGRDISSRKEAEAALVRAQVELEDRVRERTAQLSSTNRDLQTLLHAISHDLTEPLRTIESFGQLLRERHGRELAAEGRHLLHRMVRAADRLRRFLGDITLLSRFRSGECRAREVDGHEVVSLALARLEERIRQTGAKISVRGQLPRLAVEPTWATEALYNLLSNALKFTHGGRPPEVEVGPYPPVGLPSPTVGFVVRDRGPGVPDDLKERIFMLFQRGVDREVEGTGAGLAIVRQVAERHGGSAWVHPRVGGGSEFYVTFAAHRRREGGGD